MSLILISIVVCLIIYFGRNPLMNGFFRRKIIQWNNKQEIRKQKEEECRLRHQQEKADIEEKENNKADAFISQIKEIINEHKFNLVSDRKKLVTKDAYGNVNLDKWIGQPLLQESMMRLQFLVGNNHWFSKGMPYFWYKIILPRIGNKGTDAENVTVFFERWNQYRRVNPTVIDASTNDRFERERLEEDWYVEIGSYIEDICESVINESKSGNINAMNGIDYEVYCARVLRENGWKVQNTPVTGDQGVDLIATIDDVRVCIQCKHYSKPVGNKAVQEVVAGMIHWNGTHSVVVSNAGYTDAAKKLADSTSVILINEIELPDLINRVQ